MNQIEKNKLKTDQAWEQLYTRLEQDGLLDKPISGTNPIPDRTYEMGRRYRYTLLYR